MCVCKGKIQTSFLFLDSNMLEQARVGSKILSVRAISLYFLSGLGGTPFYFKAICLN